MANNREMVLSAVDLTEGWFTSKDLEKIISPDFMRGCFHTLRMQKITSMLVDLWKNGEVIRGEKDGSFRLWSKL